MRGSWAAGLQDLGLGMGVWGMVRGLTAMWELKDSKVSGSVIVTVWLAQIGRAAVSTWLPCSSLRHGTEQPCTSAPTHQTRSGTHTVLGSHRFAHADTRPRLRLFGERAKLFDYKAGGILQSRYLKLCRDWKCQVCSVLLHWAKVPLWINRACKVKPQNPKQNSSCCESLMPQ